MLTIVSRQRTRSHCCRIPPSLLLEGCGWIWYQHSSAALFVEQVPENIQKIATSHASLAILVLIRAVHRKVHSRCNILFSKIHHLMNFLSSRHERDNKNIKSNNQNFRQICGPLIILRITFNDLCLAF